MPSPPFVIENANDTLSGETLVIRGKKYADPASGLAGSNADRFGVIADADIGTMARYVVATFGKSFDVTNSNNALWSSIWLYRPHHGITPQTPNGNAGGKAHVVGEYSAAYSPGSTKPYGGNPLQSLTSWAEGLTHILGNLLDPHFWLRIAEVVIGSILVAVGMAHISDSARTAIKGVPALGKVIT